MEEKAIVNKNESGEISLKEFILKIIVWYRYLLSKWLVIISLGALGGILGFAYASYKKPVYIATTTFVLEENDKGGGLGQYGAIASLAGIDLGGGGGGIFQGDNIMELYKSRIMVENTLLSTIKYKGQEQLLIDRYIQLNKFRESWNKDPLLKNVDFHLKGGQKFTRAQDSLLGVFVNDIAKNYLFVSKPDKKLGIISVDVKSNDELFAKLFNDQIVKNVNDFYVRTKTKKSLANLEILQHQTDSVRNVLNGAIYNSAAVADATPNLNPTRQVLRAPAQRSQYNAEANKAILSQLLQNLELSKIALRKETPLIQVIDEAIFPLKKEKLGKAKGIIVGGIFAGIITVILLLIRKSLMNVMK